MNIDEIYVPAERRKEIDAEKVEAAAEEMKRVAVLDAPVVGIDPRLRV